MTKDTFDYLLGLRSRPMTDAERVVADAEAIVHAYAPARTLPDFEGRKCRSAE
jgi:hypothetical protein